MKAELMSYGFVVGGPRNWSAYKPTREEAELWITNTIEMAKNADLVGADGVTPFAPERDDFTITEVFAKVWRGALINPDGTSNPIPADWDTQYAAQTLKDATDAITALGALETPDATQ